MNLEETAQVLNYLHADGGVMVREEKVATWFDAFGDVPMMDAMTAARWLSKNRKPFGEYQRNDFQDALNATLPPPVLPVVHGSGLETYESNGRTYVRCTKEARAEYDAVMAARGLVKVVTELGGGRQSIAFKRPNR